MGIEVIWDDDTHTCIRYNVRGGWTFEDLRTARQEVHTLIAGRQEKIPIIIDLRGSQLLPENMFSHFGTRSYDGVDELGFMVFVGSNSLVRGMFASFQRIYPKRAVNWQFAANLDEARRLVQERTRLNALLQNAGDSR